MRRPVYEATDGTDRLRIAQQYDKLPERGLTASVVQRTTGAGRSVLLTPTQVASLIDALSAWLPERAR